MRRFNYLKNIFLIVVFFLASCESLDDSLNNRLGEERIEQGQDGNTQLVNYLDQKVSRYAYSDKNIALASVNPIATRAGLNAFASGGNAVDAALAMAFTLGVVDSHNSGIGGGCFILYRGPDGKVLAIDGREMAPALAHRDMYIKDGEYQRPLSKTGALAIGIPGSVAALDHLQKSLGRLNFSDVLLPAADIAEQGFTIDKVLAARMARTEDRLRKFPNTKSIYIPKDTLLNAGDMLIQSDLANTYRQLAKKGPDYFYQGDFAKKVDAWMKQNDGLVRLDDFKQYHIKERDPIESTFNEFTVLGFPTPSSGGIHVAQILNILDEFDLGKLSEGERYHLIIEAMKLAFADRAHWLGDADFVDVPKGLITKDYARILAKKINLNQSTNVPSFSFPPNHQEDVFNKHTTHISAADAEGNWVAITTTLNTSFGSKVVIPGTGVLMNNQMDDFSAQPGKANAFGLVGAEANSIAPGKRPLSSMSPTIVLKNNEPVMTLGAAGGPTIISQVLQTIVNHLALKKPLKQAMESVRVHHQWKPDRVIIDGFASEELKSSLESKGHTLKSWPSFGATQAISRKKESGEWVFKAEAEPRIQD